MSRLIRRRPLLAFFVLTYLISWVGLSPLVASATGLIGASVSPTFHVLGALGPFLSAMVVTRIVSGSQGVRDLWARLRRWRVSWIWWMLAVVSPFLLFALAYPVAEVTAPGRSQWVALRIAAGDPAWIRDLLIASVCYGYGEEMGWRGFALPRLQAGRSALTATLVLAVAWACWHVPFFFYRFPWGGPIMIAGFFLGLLAGAVWLTFLFNSTGGSILIVAMWHMTWNLVNVAGIEISENAVAVMSGLVMVLALLVLIITRPSRLSVTEKFVLETTDSGGAVS